MPRPAVLLRSAHERGWRAFSDPARTFVAHTPGEVVTCLRRVQQAVDASGCWAAGFVCYEAAAAFGLPVKPGEGSRLPLVWFGLFPPAHVTTLARLDPATPHATGPWQASIAREEYLHAIARIKDRIAAGDTYQINFTFRFHAPFSGDPLGLLDDLDRGQRGRWAACVDIGTHVICSASPELFFRLDGARIVCRPMKGTAPRGRWVEDDRRQAIGLQRSTKNRAENVMIVDMTRNDLGRIARPGSVTVTSLFEIERYPGQWQMTSSVRAETRTADLPSLFEALFPSGSVTGAPKRSSMAIIRELERDPRGVYTGAIGCVSPEWHARFNVAIRTVTIDRERQEAEFGAGSGVVWDSIDSDEYDECLNKAAMLTRRQEPFRLLETLRWSPAEGFVRIEAHLARMRASSAYFGFPLPDVERVRADAQRAVDRWTRETRVRILLDADGLVEVQAAGLEPLPDPVQMVCAADPVSSSDEFLFHKTTNRQTHARARASRPGADTVLLWNERGEVTEAAEANVVVEIEGRRITPRIDCGLLPGVLRAQLLRRGEIEEGIVRLEDLPRASRIWVINSARGWLRAQLERFT